MFAPIRGGWGRLVFNAAGVKKKNLLAGCVGVGVDGDKVVLPSLSVVGQAW